MSIGAAVRLKTSNHSPKLAPPEAFNGSAMSSLMTMVVGSTCNDAVAVTPFSDVAVIVASPVVTPVARPDGVTVATSIGLLDHVNAVRGTGWFEESNAVAVNCCGVPPVTLAVAGATTMLATGGGGTSASLHAPNVLVPFAQVFEVSRARDNPTSSVPASDAPM